MLTFASGASFVLVLRLAVHGRLSLWVIALLLPATFLGAVASAMGRGFARRGDFQVIAVAAVLGLPFLGAGGLVDPWETHYAEVAREMIVRRDLVSPWWANEGWFRSKPVLTFWLEAASMVLLGAPATADAVLHGGAQPEWALRFPHWLCALAGTLLLHDGVARAAGRRAALLGAVALWTMPGFALLTHQALTDMPLVAGIAGALGLVLRIAVTREPIPISRRARIAAVTAIAIVTLGQSLAFLAHHRALAGDPFACGLPGQPVCAPLRLAFPRLGPLVQLLVWVGPAGIVLERACSARDGRRLLALGAWAACAFAAMAKGPAGLAIPVGAVAVLVVVRWRLRELRALEIGAGLVLVAAMLGPWYLAAYARHGRPFLDELVVRNMLGRTLEHLHDTNEGEDTGIVYFVRQLGYATFPWSGIAIVSVLGEDRRRIARTLLFGAAALSFGLVSWMQTKFHHYALVALPPIAMLGGMGLDELLRARRPGRERLVIAAAITALVGRDVARVPTRFIGLVSYRYTRLWPSTAELRPVVVFVTVLAVLGLVLALRWRRLGVVVLVAGALGLGGVLLDRYLVRCAEDGGQRSLLLAYYAAREDSSPLVAYQLNWKGESFYTGNDVAIFIASGAPFQAYLESRRTRGQRTVFFLAERARVDRLRRELGAVVSFEERATSPEYALVRARL